MADQKYITFRPRNDQEASFRMIQDWCADNGHSVSAILNSFIDAIGYSLQHSTFFNEEDGKFYVKADFGDVPIIACPQGRHKTWIEHINMESRFTKKKKIK